MAFSGYRSKQCQDWCVIVKKMVPINQLNLQKSYINKTAKITRRLRNLMLLRSQLATVEF